MVLPPGTRLGVYEIGSLLGAGGMGEVYRARDTRPAMAREVAVKILPETSGSDDRRHRFEQEARAMAALNHPNLLAIYDVGTHPSAGDGSAGTLYLVEELLEGTTLREVLARGALAPRRAIEYARAIALGLAAAHAKGFVHRDLKPENVMLTGDGRVKILDFGLAKLHESARSPDAATTAHQTGAGTVLGTVAYMSPEQVRGLPLDHRSDIFSLGVVLYEMLTGERPFTGDTAPDTQASILNAEPRELPTDRAIPPALDRVVRRCLEKPPEQRFQSASDLAFALDALSSVSSSGAAAALAAPSTRTAGGRAGWIAAAVASLAALALGAAYARRPPVERLELPPSVRFSEVLPTLGQAISGAGSGFPNPAFSPDGRSVVLVAPTVRGGRPMLWIRALAGDTRTIGDTEGASFPFWSADSRSIGFFANGKLRRVDVDGSGLRVICDAPSGGGGTWNADDTIVFAPSTRDGLFRVSGRGGTPVKVTTLDAARKELAQTQPVFLPDGRRFLYFSVAPDGGAVYLAALGSGGTTRVVASNSGAQYSAGYLLYVVRGELVARAFDPASAAVGPDEVPIAAGVLTPNFGGTSAFAVSTTGTLAYRTETPTLSQIVWSDRSGTRGAALGEPGPWVQMALSPDDRQLAVQLGTGPASDLWLFDVARGVGSRLTVDGNNNGPVWSPDGRELAYRSNRRALNEVFRLSLATNTVTRWDGVPSERLEDWSRDGRYVVLGRAADGVPIAVALTGDRTPIPLAAQIPGGASDEMQFSPDSRWLSYNNAATSGRPEIYLQPFPGRGQRMIASVGGGSQAKWRADGRELFYLSPDGTMMAVDVRPGDPIALGRPRPLFKTGIAAPATNVDQYVVTRDGQRFLMIEPTQSVEPPSLTIITNWTNLLKK